MDEAWDRPDLVSLALLGAVAEEGSISRGAARFGISQPSASQRLRHLERALGLELLDRRASGAVPTEAGRLVVGWAEEVGTAVHRLTAGVDALRSRQRQSLAVAASYTIAEYLLPGWLAALRRRHPTASVTLEVVNSTGVETSVREGRADLGFVEAPRVGPGLAGRRVATDDLVVVVAPGHPWAGRRRSLPAPVVAGTPLVVREHGSGTRAALDRAWSTRDLVPSAPALELGSTSAVVSAVEAEVAPTVVSRLAVARHLDDRRLIAVPVDGLDLRRTLRAVWRRGSMPGSLATDLLEMTRSPPTTDHGRSAGVAAGPNR